VTITARSAPPVTAGRDPGEIAAAFHETVAAGAAGIDLHHPAY
jgi:hypothetical protein